MSMDNELKQMLNLVLEHNEQIEKLDLYIRMKNGTKLKYKIDRLKESKILKALEKQIEKQKERLAHKQEKRRIKEEKQGRSAKEKSE